MIGSDITRFQYKSFDRGIKTYTETIYTKNNPDGSVDRKSIGFPFQNAHIKSNCDFQKQFPITKEILDDVQQNIIQMEQFPDADTRITILKRIKEAPLQVEVNNLKKQLNTANKTNVLQQQTIQKQNKNIEALKKEAENLKHTIDNLNGTIVSLRSQLAVQQSQIAILQAQVDRLNDTFCAIMTLIQN